MHCVSMRRRQQSFVNSKKPEKCCMAGLLNFTVKNQQHKIGTPKNAPSLNVSIYLSNAAAMCLKNADGMQTLYSMTRLLLETVKCSKSP